MRYKPRTEEEYELIEEIKLSKGFKIIKDIISEARESVIRESFDAKDRRITRKNMTGEVTTIETATGTLRYNAGFNDGMAFVVKVIESSVKNKEEVKEE